VDEKPVEPAPLPYQLRKIEALSTEGAEEKTVEMTIQLGAPRGEVMGINGKAHHTMLEGRIGETQIWNLVNNTDFAHPFHVHGYFFQVLDASRIPEWKDTVNLPAKSSMRIAIRFDDRPGVWMVHCHILDHADGGMMAHLRVTQ
jgi:FtsP/CotA-like multicopper oxidase with cupredoxin domain